MKKFFKKLKKKDKDGESGSVASGATGVGSKRSGSLSRAGSSTVEIAGYIYKVKELPKLHKAVWEKDMKKVLDLVKKDPNPVDKHKR